MTLLVRLLGPVQLSRADQPVSMRGNKAMGLLAYLLSTKQAHSRQHLIDLLFDGPDDPRASLRWILSELRKSIGSDFILADRQQIAFNFDSDYWLDVSHFEAGQTELYRGDFLEGLNVRDAFGFEEWTLFERERLRKIYQNALVGRLAEVTSQENIPAIIETAHKLLQLDNLREEWYRALIEAYARQGRREAALAQFDLCRQTLKAELGIEPSAETTALDEQIRSGSFHSIPQQRQDIPLNSPPFLEQPDGDAGPLFVAREQELEQLDNFLIPAQSGQGRVIFVTGDAGSGKTSLLQEFILRAQRARPDLIVAGGNCNAFTGVGDPYLPFREILVCLSGDVEARWEAGLINTIQARRLWSLIPHTVQALVDSGPDLLDIFIPGPALLQRATAAASGEANWLSQLKQLVARRQSEAVPANLRQQTNLFEQYTIVLQELARRQPLLLVLDDLQWADAGSINLLFHLGRRLQRQRILIVGIYRPAEVALGRPSADSGEQERHPLQAVINEFQRNYGQIHINLNQSEGRSFINALLDSEPHRLPETFKEALFQHSQGHALFTVEMLRGMQERGDLTQDEQGRWVEGPDLDWNTLPARIEGIIEERIGRLPVSQREILRAASVEGEIFTAEVVAQAQGDAAPEVVRLLSGSLDRQHRLVRSQGSRLLSSEGQRLSHYQFRHILFQRYLYGSLDDTERAYLHEAVGNILEQLYQGQHETVALQLARHFQMAGLIEKAVGYLQQAGRWAVRLSAHKEAIAHFTRALGLLGTLPDSEQHAQQELDLQLALGRAFIVVKGSGAPEVERTFVRARELCQQVGESSQLVQVLWGLCVFYVIRGKLRGTGYDMAKQCLQVAQSQQESNLLIGGHMAVGTVALYRGELNLAQTHFEQGIALYDPQQSTILISLYGYDPGVFCQRELAWVKWMKGYPQQALDLIRETITLARTLTHAFNLAGALAIATYIHYLRREVWACQETAKETIALSTEHGVVLWRLVGSMLQGWVFIEQGNEEAGIEQIRHGVNDYRATGLRTTASAFLLMMARANLRLEQIAQGLAVLEDVLKEVEETGECFEEAECYRLKGELLLRNGADDDEVERQFFKAIDIARRQSAKSWELRATTSLCRLWHSRGSQGKKEEARRILADIYGWFSEGFDTLDLKEAQALLEELS